MFTTNKTQVIEINKNNKIEIKVKFGKHTNIVDFEINGNLAGHLLKSVSDSKINSVWFKNAAEMLFELYTSNAEAQARNMLQDNDPELASIFKGHQKAIEKVMKLKAVNYDCDKNILIDNWATS